VIAVDTNILVYAHREDSQWYPAAFRLLKKTAEGRTAWAVPWPCIHEFLSIVTHPRIYDPPTPIDIALEQVGAWLGSPSLVLMSETAGYWEFLDDLVRRAQVRGPRVHDARVAALRLHHGVDELWSADRDFSRFPSLTVRNPLVTG
jgi:toxin-antitoxin system PIN domain toxin